MYIGVVSARASRTVHGISLDTRLISFVLELPIFPHRERAWHLVRRGCQESSVGYSLTYELAISSHSRQRYVSTITRKPRKTIETSRDCLCASRLRAVQSPISVNSQEQYDHERSFVTSSHIPQKTIDRLSSCLFRENSFDEFTHNFRFFFLDPKTNLKQSNGVAGKKLARYRRSCYRITTWFRARKRATS